jgi:glutamate 5-kinase
MEKEMNEQQPVVVKFGTSTVTEQGRLSQDDLDWYAYQIAQLQEQAPVIVVTSGAAAIGQQMAVEQGLMIDDTLQPYAMMGSAPLVVAWQSAFKKQGLLAGQLLVTHREIDDPNEGSVLLRALGDCMLNNIIPVVNENDALSIKELAKIAYNGDNDGLAAHIARAVGAQALFLMTDARGLIKPNGYRQKVVECTEEAHAEALSFVRDDEGKGRGGMRTKVQAATKTARIGITTYIGPSQRFSFASIIDGKRVGTRFEPADYVQAA